MVLWTVKNGKIYVKEAKNQMPIRRPNGKLVLDYTYLDGAMDYYSTLITAMKQPHFPKKSF